MRSLGIVIVLVGMVFLLSGAAAAVWAASQAGAMSEEDRAADPVQYDFYVSAQSCSLGSVVIGLMVMAMGFLVGRRPASAGKNGQGEGAGGRLGPSDRAESTRDPSGEGSP